MRAISGIVAVSIIALMLLLPEVLPGAFVYLIGLTFLFIILTVSWDIMVGYTGQVNLGHTVFVGVGAYTTALLQTQRLQGTPLEFLAIEPPIYLSIIAGGVMAALIGFVIGVITLRLKGYYFALVTAILPLVFAQSVYIWSDVFGGEEGFSVGLNKVLTESIIGNYYAAFFIMLISIAIMLFLVKSPLGLKLRALREDQELAEASGIDTVKYKLVAFIISSFFAGIGGAAIIHYRITVGPDLYGIPLMLIIILSTVIGGLGTIYGPIAGGFFIYLSKNWFLRELIDNTFISELPVNDEIILYIILIVIAIFMPHGVYHSIRNRLGM